MEEALKEAVSFEAASFEAASFELASLEASSFEACLEIFPFEAASCHCRVKFQLTKRSLMYFFVF